MHHYLILDENKQWPKIEVHFGPKHWLHNNNNLNITNYILKKIQLILTIQVYKTHNYYNFKKYDGI